jgi:hypothetical protein
MHTCGGTVDLTLDLTELSLAVSEDALAAVGTTSQKSLV